MLKFWKSVVYVSFIYTGKAVLFPVTKPLIKILLCSHETVPVKSYSQVTNMYIV